MSTLTKLFNGTWKVVKTGFKAIIIFFIIVFIIGVFTVGVEDTDTNGSSTPTSTVEKWNIQNIHATSSFGIMTITGTITVNKDYEYLQIEIPTYDSEGNKVGSALANISDLEKGDTWKFEAVDVSGGTRYNMDKAEVSGW